MSVIPIDEAGIEAFEAVFYRQDPQDAIRPLHEAVSAYLSAIGARTEGRKISLDGGTTWGTEARLTTDWRPLTATEQFESEDAMRFGPRSYTPNQQAVIDQAVTERKPLTAPRLTTTKEETDER